MGEFSK